MKRLLLLIVRMVTLLIAISIVSFLLVTKAPIDPLTAYIGANSTISEEAKEEISEYWGLGQPLGAVPCLGREYLAGGFWGIHCLPAASAPGDTGAVPVFAGADAGRMDQLRPFWLPSGDCCGGISGQHTG